MANPWRCSDTLECVNDRFIISAAGPIDLSRATKPKRIESEFCLECVALVTAALNPITPPHVYIEQVSIHVHIHPRRVGLVHLRFGVGLFTAGRL